MDLNNKYGIEPSAVAQEEKQILQEHFCCDESLPSLLAYLKSTCGMFLMDKMGLINSARLARSLSALPLSTSLSNPASCLASPTASSSSSFSFPASSPSSSSLPSSCLQSSTPSSDGTISSTLSEAKSSSATTVTTTTITTTAASTTTTTTTATAKCPSTPPRIITASSVVPPFTSSNLSSSASAFSPSPIRQRSVNPSPAVSRSCSPFSESPMEEDVADNEDTPSFSCHALQYPTYLLLSSLSPPAALDASSPCALVFEALTQMHFHIGIKEKYLRNPDFSRLNRAESRLAKEIRDKGLANEDNTARLSAILLELADETDVGALSIIQKEMATLQQWKEFHPLMISGQLASSMTALIVDSVIKQKAVEDEDPRRSFFSQERSKLTPTRLRELLLQYCALAHLLTAFAVRYPVIRRRANERVNSFLSDPSTRTKTHTHDLGQFLIHFLLSDTQWDKLAILILLELFDRQVRWLLQKFPECQVQPEGERGPVISRCYRLSRAWESGLVGCQLFMLQVLFFRLTKENLLTRTSESGFHRTLGAPRERDVQQLLKWSDTIMKIDGWPQFFDLLQVARLSPNNLEARLKQAQWNSLDKGYHSKFRVHHLERTKFAQCLCPKGLCRYADVDLPKSNIRPCYSNAHNLRHEISKNNKINPSASAFKPSSLSCTSSTSSTSSPSSASSSFSSSSQSSYASYATGYASSLVQPSSYSGSAYVVQEDVPANHDATLKDKIPRQDDNNLQRKQWGDEDDNVIHYDEGAILHEEDSKNFEELGQAADTEGWEVIASKKKKEPSASERGRHGGDKAKTFGRGAFRGLGRDRSELSGRGRGRERKHSDPV